MFLRELKEPVKSLNGVGNAAVYKLARLGISTVADLLCHYPRDWEDRRQIAPLKDWNKSRVYTEVQVLAHDWFGVGPMRTLKIYVQDESARACLVCYNRPFLEKKLPPGIRCRLYGTFSYKRGDIQTSAFDYELLDGSNEGAGNISILPVYPLTSGLAQNTLRKLTRQALDQFASVLEDELPEAIISRDTLLHKPHAVEAIHFPASPEELEKAKKTLVYEQLFYLEVMIGKRAMRRKGTGTGEWGTGNGERGMGNREQGTSLVPSPQSLVPNPHSPFPNPQPLSPPCSAALLSACRSLLQRGRKKRLWK